MTTRETKKQNEKKKCITERKLKFEDYKKCLEVTQLENEINYIEKINLKWTVKKKTVRNS